MFSANSKSNIHSDLTYLASMPQVQLKPCFILSMFILFHANQALSLESILQANILLLTSHQPGGTSCALTHNQDVEKKYFSSWLFYTQKKKSLIYFMFSYTEDFPGALLGIAIQELESYSFPTV